MLIGFFYSFLNEPFEDILNGLEAFCVAFNQFAVIFFGFMKYILVFILIILAFSTLTKLRGHYIQERMRMGDLGPNSINQFKKPRLILGTVYIVLAFGILFNYLTIFLMWLLDPLPDRLVFTFINFTGIIDPLMLNRIMDISTSIYPHEQTIYYCIAIGSFAAIVDIVIAVWTLVDRLPSNPKISFSLLISGVTAGILLGFTTCLPFFL
ncbi:MAG: hypothetical protein ACFFAT_21680 [Promethearchaeota archaeon]